MGELKAAFTKTHEDKIEDWLVTYFEQQEKFFLHKKYGHKDWAPFEYNGTSFVKFFETNIMTINYISFISYIHFF